MMRTYKDNVTSERIRQKGGTDKLEEREGHMKACEERVW